MSFFHEHGKVIELRARARLFGSDRCYNAGKTLEGGVHRDFKHMRLNRLSVVWQACGGDSQTAFLQAEGKLRKTGGAVAVALPTCEKDLTKV